MNMKGVAFPSHAQTESFYFCSFPATILEANDSLTQVINLYRQLVKGEEVSAEETTTQQPGKCTRVLSYTSVQQIVNRCALCLQPGSALVDLMGLSTSASTAPSSCESSGLQSLTQNAGISLLDDELASLGEHKEERKNSWLVNINVDDQALNKRKKNNKVSRGCTVWGSHLATAQNEMHPF